MDKESQRRSAIWLRRNMDAAARVRASLEICRRLQALPEILNASVIFSYLAMPEEVELEEFHAWARARGIVLAFPVTGEGGEMEAYAPKLPCQWGRDRFGIRMPEVASSCHIAPEEISLVLAPCVAFDEKARRLGQGGGYYDRYFLRCPQAYRVGVAFEAQRLPEIVCTDLDVSLHTVVTQRRIYLAP